MVLAAVAEIIDTQLLEEPLAEPAAEVPVGGSVALPMAGSLVAAQMQLPVQPIPVAEAAALLTPLL